MDCVSATEQKQEALLPQNDCDVSVKILPTAA